MKKFKPTTPSRRHMTAVSYADVLTHKKPLKQLTKKLKERAGRNNAGRITMRHQGGGNKKLYRLVDFKQRMLGVQGRVEGIEYDPYRTAFIARVVYVNGVRAYVLATAGMKVGTKIISDIKTPLVEGNRMQLQHVPVGYQVHNVELNPGKGGQIIKSAGAYAEVLANDEGYTTLKMPSGEVRKVLWTCAASIGQISNPDHSLVTIGKAGRSRWLGIRPTVRGTAMNPVDHKYGGGEGRQKRGTRRPKDIWGNITGGRKTRKKGKWSQRLIVKRRK
jgi:large subunit ribosomal protein L2